MVDGESFRTIRGLCVPARSRTRKGHTVPAVLTYPLSGFTAAFRDTLTLVLCIPGTIVQGSFALFRAGVYAAFNVYDYFAV